MKLLFSLSFFSLLGVAVAFGQDTTSVLSKYPLLVVMKVKDVSSVVLLTSDKQVMLANHFQKEMNQMQSLIQSDASAKQINQAKEALQSEFESILTTDELNLYGSKKKGSEYIRPVLKVASPPANNSIMH